MNKPSHRRARIIILREAKEREKKVVSNSIIKIIEGMILSLNDKIKIFKSK